MKEMISLAKENFMNVLNSDEYFVYTKEDYDEYLEWKSTLSDWELKEGFRFSRDCYDYEKHKITFSWYMKNRDYLKQYYERTNNWRKLKPNQFLKKTNVERIDYNEWNW